MRDAASRHGAPLIDAGALFREAGAGADALFVDEMHPSRRGHALLGQALADALRHRVREGAPLEARTTGGEVPVYEDPFEGRGPR